MTHGQLRKAYLDFFKEKGHVVLDPAPLVLQGDATTLFTSSGMQPLVPYLSGKEKHPDGVRLVDVQPCVRTGDIDEVGDNSHLTFFEMIGNWSLGDYFKEEQLAWKWEFFTKILGLPAEKLYVTVFEGAAGVPRDDESAAIWRKLGLPESHIFFYGAGSNWWSRSGPPDSMPVGEIGGPDSEVFYELTSGDPLNGPEEDESRFIEIGNSVFMQYEKATDGSLKMLPQKNVDFGGGFERLAAVLHGSSVVYTTDIFQSLIQTIEESTQSTYDAHVQDMRIIADHMRAATFLIHHGVTPSNKEHGYILRRLLRRAAIRMHGLVGGVEGLSKLPACVDPVLQTYKGVYFDGSEGSHIQGVIAEEMSRFGSTLERGLREIGKRASVDGKVAFDLFQSYGFPIELTSELAAEKGISLDMQEFEAEKQRHRELSQSSSAGKFKGGLADSSDQVLKYHTATHLLHQALKDVFGDTIRQEGSNITQERLRFDTRLDRKPTDEEISRVQKIMNAKIEESLPVYKKDMPREEAEKLGAASFFREKYGDVVSVYFIGDYSKEFCGGPHVENTSEIGPLEITKVKSIGSNTVRIYVNQAHG
jgi:alanyl-tRNA synthetase